MATAIVDHVLGSNIVIHELYTMSSCFVHAGTARLADKIRQVCIYNHNEDKQHAFERLS